LTESKDGENPFDPVRIASTAAKAVAAITVVTGILYLSTDLKPGRLLEILSSTDPVAMAVAVAVYLSTWPLRGERYRGILGKIDVEVSAKFSTASVFVSQTANLVLPARGGDGVRAVLVQRRTGKGYSEAVSSLVAERIYDLASIFLITFGGMAATIYLNHGLNWRSYSLPEPLQMPIYGEFTELITVGLALTSVVLLVATVFHYHLRSRAGSMNAYLPDSTAERTEKIYYGILGFLKNVYRDTVDAVAKGSLRTYILSISIWLLDAVVAVTVFVGVGLEAPPYMIVPVSVFAVGVGNIAKVLPLSPGGIGLYEIGFGFIAVTFLNMGWTVAISVAVLDHLLKNAVTVAGFLFSVSSLDFSVKNSGSIDGD